MGCTKGDVGMKLKEYIDRYNKIEISDESSGFKFISNPEKVMIGGKTKKVNGKCRLM